MSYLASGKALARAQRVAALGSRPIRAKSHVLQPGADVGHKGISVCTVGSTRTTGTWPLPKAVRCEHGPG
jgi:hypothetical protein